MVRAKFETVKFVCSGGHHPVAVEVVFAIAWLVGTPCAWAIGAATQKVEQRTIIGKVRPHSRDREIVPILEPWLTFMMGRLKERLDAAEAGFGGLFLLFSVIR